MKNIFILIVCVLVFSNSYAMASKTLKKEKHGYVYIIENTAFPDSFIKIGMTTRNPEKRLKELSGTSVPYPFKPRYIFETDSPRSLEKAFHTSLDIYRLRKDREFFEIPDYALDSAVRILIPLYNADTVQIREAVIKIKKLSR